MSKELVKLPKEIVQELKRKEPYRSEGLAYLMWECTSSDNKIAKWIDTDDNNVFKLSQALVNGYEVDLTPEDKVRELYDFWLSGDEPRNVYDGKTIAGEILEVLNLLNIKIKGVNAE